MSSVLHLRGFSLVTITFSRGEKRGWSDGSACDRDDDDEDDDDNDEVR